MEAKMKNTFLVITAFLSISVYCSIDLSLFYKDISSAPVPIKKLVTYSALDELNLKIPWGDNTIYVSNKEYFQNSLVRIASKNDASIFPSELSYCIVPQYVAEIYLCDLNGDKISELIIESHPVGCSGILASLTNVAVIAHENGKFRVFELNTFFQGIRGSFYDIDNNGKYEFVCLKVVHYQFPEYGKSTYVSRTFFEFTGENFIRKRIDGNFSTLFETLNDENGWFKVDKIPKSLVKYMELSIPKAYNRSKI